MADVQDPYDLLFTLPHPKGAGKKPRRLEAQPKPLGGKKKKKQWLYLISATPKDGEYIVKLKVDGVPYRYVVPARKWNQFLGIAKRNRGHAMAHLRQHATRYKRLGKA